MLKKIIKIFLLVLSLCLLSQLSFSGEFRPVKIFPITGGFSAKHLEDREHISIIEFSGNYDKNLNGGEANTEPRALVAQEFYKTHKDNYDFLVVFTSFEFETGEKVWAFASPVRNDVQGIGINQYDNSDLFGSNGKLRSYIDMAALSRTAQDPEDPLFEYALSTLAHEVLHTWGIQVKYEDKNGNISENLLGSANSHWSYLLDTNASLEYGHKWRDNNDGSYTSVAHGTFYSPLDLYLMGFVSKDEVPPFKLLINPEIDRQSYSELNKTISAEEQIITINDIIAAEGERVPASSDAQKEFRMAFILLTEKDEEVSEIQIATLNNVRQEFAKRFSILTGGRGIVEVYPEVRHENIQSRPDILGEGEERVEKFILNDALQWLRNQQQVNGTWGDKTASQFRDTTHVASVLKTIDTNFDGDLKALNWISDNETPNIDFLARKIISISTLSALEPPDELYNEIKNSQNDDGGWGIKDANKSDIQDTALVLEALGYSKNINLSLIKTSAQNYLLERQNNDGGWGYRDNNQSDIQTTYFVLKALNKIDQTKTNLIEQAFNWLKIQQQAGGYFSVTGDDNGEGRITSTSEVLSVLMLWNELDRIDSERAVFYLQSRQNKNGSWQESSFITSLVASAIKTYEFPNFELIAMNASLEAPKDGEKIKINLSVMNTGNATSPATILRLYDGDPNAGGIQIGSDYAINEMAYSAQITLSPIWDTFDQPGEHQLYAVIDPNTEVAELNEQDNIKSITINVASAPDKAELSVVDADINFVPGAITQLPGSIGISVTVRNYGKENAANVQVELWGKLSNAADYEFIDNQIVNLSQRTSRAINFTQDISQNMAHDYQVTIDKNEQYDEQDETNNIAYKTLAIKSTVDLAISETDISQGSPTIFQGDDLHFNLIFHNNGTTAISTTPVKVSIVDNQGTSEIELIELPSIAPGKTLSRSLTWRVDRIGNIKLQVSIDPDNQVPEQDETNNIAEFEMTATSAIGFNLAVNFNALTFEPTPAKEMNALTLSSVVRNTGTEDISNIKVNFYHGDPYNSGLLIGSEVIDILTAGNEVSVQTTWDQVPDSTEKILFVVVDPDNVIDELSEQDNNAFNTLKVNSLPDLIVAKGDFSLFPKAPSENELVTLTVPVNNLGQQSADNVLIRLFDGDPKLGGQQIESDKLLTIAANSGETISFSWQTGGSPGAHTLFLQVDPSDNVLEQNENNNQANFSYAVQNSELYLSEKYISPNGDGIQDSTEVFFSFSEKANLDISIIDKNDKKVKTFDVNEFKNIKQGSFKWNGLDDNSRLVIDGDYHIVITANSIEKGQLLVHLDTNHSSLLDIAGTDYEQLTNLTCELNATDIQFSQDDGTILSKNISSQYYNNFYPEGLLKMDKKGQSINFVFTETWISQNLNSSSVPLFATDELGETIAFIAKDMNGDTQLWIANDGYDPIAANTLSIDNGKIYFTQDSKKLYIIGNSSIFKVELISGYPVTELFTTTGYFSSGLQSGNKITYANYENNQYKLILLDLVTDQEIVLDTTSEHPSHQWSPNSEFILTYNSYNIDFPVKIFNQNGELYQSNLMAPLKGAYVQSLAHYQWSNDSNELAVNFVTCTSSGDNDGSGIFLYSLNDNTFKKIASTYNEYGCDFSYHISTWNGSNWIERDVISYQRFYQEKTSDFSSYLPDADGEFKIRIRQQGKEAAHIEKISLNVGITQNSLMPESIIDINDAENKGLLASIKQVDNQVIDAFGKEFEVKWELQSARAQHISLSLIAREESLSKLKTRPFSYPENRNNHYSYLISTESQPMQVDGLQTGSDRLEKSLFQHYSRPQTGHPSAQVNGYLSNDDTHLYAALDFTVDNTLDKQADWASVFIQINGQWKQYKVNVVLQEYGTVGFIPTAFALYPHKYYEFKIPLAELEADIGDTINIRFEAYGTAALVDNDCPACGDTVLPSSGNMRWAPYDRAILYYHGDNSFFSIFPDEKDSADRIRRLFSDWEGFIDIKGFTPTGRGLVFQSNIDTSNQQSQCYNTAYRDEWVLRTLLNLTGDLQLIRTGGLGVVIKGTATDKHFKNYSIDYAPVSDSPVWIPVVETSETEVIDNFITSWAPPSNGQYFLRLTVRDKAGNSNVIKKILSFSDTPLITDLKREPELFSPNGDTVLDNTTISYKVLKPSHFSIDIYPQDDEGNTDYNTLIKTFTANHSTVGEIVSMVWDGRNSKGLPVSDGQYTIKILDFEFPLEIDTSAPVLKTSIDDMDTFYVTVDVPKPHVEQFPFLSPSITFSGTDNNLFTIELFSSEGNENKKITTETAKKKGESNNNISYKVDRGETRISLKSYMENDFIIKAVDAAGNEANIVLRSDQEKIYIINAGDHLRQSYFSFSDSGIKQIQKNDLISAVSNSLFFADKEFNNIVLNSLFAIGSRIMGGQWYQEFKPLKGVVQSTRILWPQLPFINTLSLKGMYPLLIGPVRSSQIRFMLSETIKEPLQTIIMQYRVAGTQEWSEEASQQIDLKCNILVSGCEIVNIPELIDQKMMMLWQSDYLKAGEKYEVRVKAISKTGKVHFSNGFSMIPEWFYLVEKKIKPRTEDFVTLYALFKKEHKSLNVYLQSDSDERYLSRVSLGNGRKTFINGEYLFTVNDLIPCKKYHFTAVAVTDSDRVFTTETKLSVSCTGVEIGELPIASKTCNTPYEQGRSLLLQALSEESLNKLRPKSLSLYKQVVDIDENVSYELLSSILKPEIIPFDFKFPKSKSGYLVDFKTSELDDNSRVFFKSDLLDSEDSIFSNDYSILVDKTPPDSRFVYPQDGQRICANTNVLISIDENNYDYSLHWQKEIGSNHWSQVMTNVILPFSDEEIQIPVRNGLKYIDETKILIKRAMLGHKMNGPISVANEESVLKDLNYDGDIKLRLKVTNKEGYLQCTDSGVFFLDHTSQARFNQLNGALKFDEHHIISANDESDYNIAEIEYKIDESLNATIDVYKFTGDDIGKFTPKPDVFIKSLNQNVSILEGRHKVSWDATKTSGAIVDDGIYIIYAQFTDPCGNLTIVGTLIEVDSTPPQLEIAYPKPLDPISNLLEIVGTVNDKYPYLFRVKVSQLGSTDEHTLLSINININHDNDVLATWNNHLYEDGEYTLKLLSMDRVGNTSELTTQVKLENRGDLLTYLDVKPRLFSPNNDTLLDNTILTFELQYSALMTLNVVNKYGNIITTLFSDIEYQSGSHTFAWTGEDTLEQILSDNQYKLQLVAKLLSNNSMEQTESIEITIDTTPVEITVLQPDTEFTNDASQIIGNIRDLHFENYKTFFASNADSPQWSEIDFNDAQKNNQPLVTLNELEEGVFGLKFVALDRAENESELISFFTLDKTKPVVQIKSPENQTTQSIDMISFNIKITEEHLKHFQVSYGLGEAPNNWILFSEAETLPGPDDVTLWDVSNITDGLYTIKVLAVDKAGNEQQSEIQITLDKIPPTVTFNTPENDAYVLKPIDIIGTAKDINFFEYELYVAKADQESPNWSLLTRSDQAADNSGLYPWNVLPLDGKYVLKLIATDLADNISQLTKTVYVDQTPPVAPINLSYTLDEKKATIQWTENTEDDLVGYNIYRADQKINNMLLTENIYIDLTLSDGHFQYNVTAVDKAGWESPLSEPLEVVIDLTPPITKLYQPDNEGLVSGVVNIEGTAFSPDDFKVFLVSVGKGNDPNIWETLAQSPVPSQSEKLASWDTFLLENNTQYTIKLEAFDLNENMAEDRHIVIVDNLAPAAPINLQLSQDTNNIQLNWSANIEDDLLGYLVYRNEAIANAQGVVIGSLVPYVITANAYLDTDLPDGQYEFFIVAIDKAGNQSNISNKVNVTIDERAPHAVIITPETETKFEHNLYIEAHVEDTDIAQIQFQYKAELLSLWENIGLADTEEPYAFELDMNALEYGRYQIRAVAMDLSTNIDPSPESIILVHKDMTAPESVNNLKSLVDGDQVTLTWDAGSEPGLSFHIERQASNSDKIRITNTLLTETTYIDTGREDEHYIYTVVSYDASENHDLEAPSVEADVYTPILNAIYTPSQVLNQPFSGHGNKQTTVMSTLQNQNGTSVLPEFLTDDSGLFSQAIQFSYGENRLDIKLRDEDGNISKLATKTIIIAEAPSKPIDLLASATGLDVNLNWTENPVNENVKGYIILRNETLLPELKKLSGISAKSSSTRSMYYGSYKAVDAYKSSYWSSKSVKNSYPSEWLSLSLSGNPQRPVKKFISKLQLSWGPEIAPYGYYIDVWTDTEWLTIKTIENNTESENLVVFDTLYATSDIRIVIDKPRQNDSYGGYINITINDIEVYEQPVITINSFNDTVIDGVYHYQIIALNEYALASEPSDKVTVPAGDVTAPEPVILSAAAINPQDNFVQLSWSKSVSDDAVSYNLYRDGELLSLINDVNTLSYTDSDIKNGVYNYTIRVVDNVGLESIDSNTISAMIDISLPFQPIDLTLQTVPAGQSLLLNWNVQINNNSYTEDDVYAYEIQRSLSQNNGYQSIVVLKASELSEKSYLDDTGLENGISYFYRVTILDALNNRSISSNVVEGIPVDTRAPEPGLLIDPIKSGVVIVTQEENFPVVSGMALEPDLEIILNVNDSEPLRTRSSSSFNLVDDYDGSSAFHFISESGLYSYVNEYPLSFYQWDNEETHILSNGEFLHLEKSMVYYNNWNDDSIHQYDLITKSDKALDFSPLEITAFVRINDSDYLVIANNAQAGQVGLWSKNLDSGDISLVIAFQNSQYGYSSYAVKVSDDGQKVLLGNSNSGSLEIVNLNNGSVLLIDEKLSIDNYRKDMYAFWSTDDQSVFFYSSRETNTSKLWRYDLSDNSYTDVLSSINNNYEGQINYAQLSPEGRSIIFSDNGIIYSLILASNKVIPLWDINELYNNSHVEALDWLNNGQILITLRNDLRIKVTLPGYFEFRDIDLQLGDNIFSTVATDIFGNQGGPSMPAVATRNLDDLPDLKISRQDIVVLPAFPSAGETVRLGAVVHNIGLAHSSPVLLKIIAINTSGESQILTEQLLGSISINQKQVISIDWKTPDTIDDYTIVVEVDPYFKQKELSKVNNTVFMTVNVGQQGMPELILNTDKLQYNTSEEVSVELQVVSHTPLFDGKVVIRVEDLSGYLVQSLGATPINALAFGKTQTISSRWNTGNTFADGYRIHVLLYDQSNQPINEAISEFSIGQFYDFSSTIKTDKSRYDANENVTITGAIQYNQGNIIYKNAQLKLQVFDDAFNLLAEKVQIVSEMQPEEQAAISFNWNTALNKNDIYHVMIKFISADETEVLSESSAVFDIDSSRVQLSGDLSIDDDAPAIGMDVKLTYTITNTGTLDIVNIPLRLELMNAKTNQIVQQHQINVSAAIGENVQGEYSFSTNDLLLEKYKVQMVIEVPVNQSETNLIELDTVSFVVNDRLAPQLSILEPANDAYFSGASDIKIYASDAHSQVVETQIKLDDDNWIKISSAQAGNNYYLSSFDTLSEGIHQLQAKTWDTWGNTAMSEVIHFTVDNTAPQIEINDVAHNQYYNIDVLPVITIADTNLLESLIVLNGTEYDGLPVTEDDKYHLSVTAIDKAGNESNLHVGFYIDKISSLIQIDGVQEGGLYNIDVTPVITITEVNIASQSIQLNGVDYTSGTVISDNYHYELVVDVLDKAGNHTVKSVSFDIDKLPPNAPVVISPVNDATLTQLHNDIRGSSEPNSIVHLQLGGASYSVLADSQGEFVFSQAAFEEGENTFQLYALDRAGNSSVVISLSVMVTSVSAELTGVINSPMHSSVLIWLPPEHHIRRCRNPFLKHMRLFDRWAHLGPTHQQYGKEKLRDLIEAVMQNNQRDYKIVYNELDFINHLRSGRYKSIMLTDYLQRPFFFGPCSVWGPNHGNNVVCMTASTQYEIRAYIAAGAGLVWLRSLDDFSGDWKDITGAYSRGVIHSISQVELTQSPATDAAVYQASGHAVRTIMTQGIAVGKLYPKRGHHYYPALILNKFGQGEVVTFNFEVDKLEDMQQSIDLLSNVLAYSGNSDQLLLPGTLARIRWTASEMTPPIDISLEQSIDPLMSTVFAWDGVIQNLQDVLWELTLETDTHDFDSLIKLPLQAGDYSIDAQLFEKTELTTRSLASDQLSVSTTQSETSLIINVETELLKLETNFFNYYLLNWALYHLDNAIACDHTTKAGLEYAMEQIKWAMLAVRELDKQQLVVTQLGYLLVVYQAKWSAL